MKYRVLYCECCRKDRRFYWIVDEDGPDMQCGVCKSLAGNMRVHQGLEPLPLETYDDQTERWVEFYRTQA